MQRPPVLIALLVLFVTFLSGSVLAQAPKGQPAGIGAVVIDGNGQAIPPEPPVVKPVAPPTDVENPLPAVIDPTLHPADEVDKAPEHADEALPQVLPPVGDGSAPMVQPPAAVKPVDGAVPPPAGDVPAPPIAAPPADAGPPPEPVSPPAAVAPGDVAPPPPDAALPPADGAQPPAPQPPPSPPPPAGDPKPAQNPWLIPSPGEPAIEMKAGGWFNFSWIPSTEGVVSLELWKIEDNTPVPKFLLASEIQNPGYWLWKIHSNFPHGTGYCLVIVPPERAAASLSPLFTIIGDENYEIPAPPPENKTITINDLEVSLAGTRRALIYAFGLGFLVCNVVAAVAWLANDREASRRDSPALYSTLQKETGKVVFHARTPSVMDPLMNRRRPD